MITLTAKDRTYYHNLIVSFLGKFEEGEPLKEMYEKDFSEEDFWVLSGMSKVVLVPKEESNYVIKIPIDSDNYCEAEFRVFQKAEKEGFESFLAEIDFLEEYNGVKCYVQERVDEGGSGGYYTSKPLLSEGSYSEAYEIGFGESVLNDLCQYYGIEKTLSFIEFCVDNYINDIHEYNYGFNGDMPIIFDYSGFGQKALESRS